MTPLRILSALAALIALAGCDRPDQYGWQGYVEAEYTYVAPLETGRITALTVERGDQVQAGAPLFTLENDSQRADRDQAEAELHQAQSDLADLLKGDRPEDLGLRRRQAQQARGPVFRPRHGHLAVVVRADVLARGREGMTLSSARRSGRRQARAAAPPAWF